MRALVLHGPGSYKVEEDWPKPVTKPGWARIRVHYAGICGSDLPRFTRTGSYHHPMVLGHEFSGVVDSPAPGSTKFAVGDRVAILPIIPCGNCPGCRKNEPFHCDNYQFIGSRNDGGFAEYCLVPESNLFSLPNGIDISLGALIEPLLVGLHVVRRSGFTPGQSALVFGAGPIGLLTGLWLEVFGASRIVIADIRTESIELASQIGFTETVNPLDEEFTSITGFDHTFEAAGANQALLDAIYRTRNKGTLTVIGRDIKDTAIPLKTFETMMRRELDIKGCWGYKIEDESHFLRQTMLRKQSQIERLITHRVTLDEAVDVIRLMSEGEMHYCKVLVRI